MISARLLRCMPLDSRFFGPPRREACCSQYPRNSYLRATVISPAEQLPFGAPLWFGPPETKYIRPDSVCGIRHPLEVFTLKHARVLGPDGHAVAPGDYLLTDSAWRGPNSHPDFANDPVLRRRRPYPKIHLRGRVALIASNWSVGSFAHFATDALPRWKLMLDAGYRAEDFDHILIYHPRTASSRVLISALKFGTKVVEADPWNDYGCDELVFTSHPHLTPRYTPRLLRSVRELLPPCTPARKVYLSRNGYSRHPANADKLERLLVSHGFEIVDGADHLGALEACRNASVIVGVEGSNLFNTVFSPPGAKIVMLLWPGCPFPYIIGLSAALDHKTSIITPSAGATVAEAAFPMEHLADAVNWALNP